MIDQQEEVVHVLVTMIAPLSGMIGEIQEVDPDPGTFHIITASL